MSMKKTVLTWGLISGGLSSAIMLLGAPFWDQIGFDRAAILGYTSLVASALLIFFGVRSYRDRVAGGKITFGKGFQVGILIALVASLCYVVTWEIYYFTAKPDFCSKYTAHQLEKARARGADAAEIAKIEQEGEWLKKVLANPVTNSAMTFLEPFPFGLLSSVVSAAILRRKRPAD
jgi:hypothetical protein